MILWMLVSYRQGGAAVCSVSLTSTRGTSWSWILLYNIAAVVCSVSLFVFVFVFAFVFVYCCRCGLFCLCYEGHEARVMVATAPRVTGNHRFFSFNQVFFRNLFLCQNLFQNINFSWEICLWPRWKPALLRETTNWWVLIRGAAIRL